MSTQHARDEIDLLRSVLDTPPPDDLGLARMRARALRSMQAPPAPRHRKRVVLVAASVTLVAGLGIAIAVQPTGGDTPSTALPTGGGPAPAPLVGADTPAQEALITLAAHTGDLRPLAVRPGQFVYSHTRGQAVTGIPVGAAGEAQVVTETETRTWFAADGLRTVRMEMAMNLNAHPSTDEDARKLAAGGRSLPRPHTQVYPNPNGGPKEQLPISQPTAPGVDHPTLSWVAGLPTDPERLLAVFRAAAGTSTKHDSDYLTFKTAASFAARADALLTPAVRAALYRAIALLPGIERVAGQVDVTGRAGVAIGRNAEGFRSELILDPATSRVIGTRMVATDGADWPAGTVIAWSSTDQVVVDSVGATS
ncbi:MULTISPECIES: CU044_5270 family protein [unclassified Amycolatopsis]|uniref:CU044_5270 family protein n=1 Tax=unclassified Amycolatopsis TaxID=2618356 RepID=UPI002876F3B2|nr:MULTISPECIES: CU044_5270 family protein [unclassified Amycolatopsis]MDS0134591.1 CU044_5270 family protein [Amycolatopsis sp. 505]MDS0147510.1 CU044_5270 family protein [Amycolatopsis sp. CM201R]